MGFVTCGPNEAMVVSGFCHSRPIMVPGGRVFVWPYVQQLQKISLSIMTLKILSENVNTKRGVPISVTGIAQVKVQGKNQEMLAHACTQFLGKNDDEIRRIALETLEGHQRAIIGNMTVEEIYQDRKKFSNEVFTVASSDFLSMGLTVVSYTLKDVKDQNGYLKALGQTRIAQIQRDAKIGEAEAKRDSGIRQALAKKEQFQSKYENDALVAEQKRDFELKKAIYDNEVSAKKAESEMATALQAAVTTQSIKEAEMQIKVQERSKQIEVQEQEILRRERELDASVRKPADAEKYRLEKLAEADKNKVLLEAEAIAESIRVKGAAEAFAIEAKAKANAEQMAKKADAWDDYKEAAMIDMILDTIPKIAAEIANPISNASKITMVSTGKSSVGASKLTGEIMDVVAKLPQVVENLTGVDISKTLVKVK